jgi:spermidine/putrescine-binding protein
MTRQQMDEVKKFLLALKANAKTIAPSYGDLNNLLISGEVVATFVGWGALNVWAAKDNVTVESVEPEDGIVISVDAYAVPPTTDNRATALAWLNLMLTKEVQVAVAEELLTAVVRPDAVELIKDEQIRNLYSYDDVDGFMNKHGLNLFPSPETGAEVTFADWLKMWEEVKAG